MSTWVDVNGAKVEKEYLDENIIEAKGYEWSEYSMADLTGHVHCMICGIAINKNSATTEKFYHSKGGYLCGYCHDNFLK